MLFFLAGIRNGPLLAQNRPDTTKASDQLQDLSEAYDELSEKMENLESLDSNVVELQEAQEEALQNQLDFQCKKITRMADFMMVANSSISAMQLSNHLSVYLTTVTDLNNPTNTDLGFSLADGLENILQRTIIKGRKRIGGQPASKFSLFVKSLINNPITNALTGVLPVIKTITSITNMVSGVAFSDDDVKVEDLMRFNTQVSTYLQHYEGLATSGEQFQISNLSIQDRLDGLEIKLADLLLTRINTLYPDLDLKEANIRTQGIATTMEEHYSLDKSEEILEKILKDHTIDEQLNHEKALADKRLFFPDFELDRANLIFTEIDGLAKESLKTLRDYQTDIEAVLQHSQEAGIGQAEKIEAHIKRMQAQLTEVEKAFENAVHVKEVRNKFYRLTAAEKPSLLLGS